MCFRTILRVGLPRQHKDLSDVDKGVSLPVLRSVAVGGKPTRAYIPNVTTCPLWVTTTAVVVPK